MSDCIPEYCSRPILVLGCGNILFGDDGFGPAVAQNLQARTDLPEELCVVDAGTSVREILFDVVLSDKRPRKIIIVDAMDAPPDGGAAKPGELFRPSVDSVPLKKLDDFSMHQLPTSNLLYELREFCGVDVELIACQVQSIPERVCPGLSPPVQAAVPNAVEMILGEAHSLRRKILAELQAPQTSQAIGIGHKGRGEGNGT